ncbi:hypothetical protein [Massilia sp. CT11-137]
MDDLDLIELAVLRNLVADNWQEFVTACAEYEDVDAGKLYAKLGGDPRDL